MAECRRLGGECCIPETWFDCFLLGLGKSDESFPFAITFASAPEERLTKHAHCVPGAVYHCTSMMCLFSVRPKESYARPILTQDSTYINEHVPIRYWQLIIFSSTPLSSPRPQVQDPGSSFWTMRGKAPGRMDSAWAQRVSRQIKLSYQHPATQERDEVGKYMIAMGDTWHSINIPRVVYTLILHQKIFTEVYGLVLISSSTAQCLSFMSEIMSYYTRPHLFFKNICHLNTKTASHYPPLSIHVISK